MDLIRKGILKVRKGGRRKRAVWQGKLVEVRPTCVIIFASERSSVREEIVAKWHILGCDSLLDSCSEFCFDLRTSRSTFVFAAVSEVERDEWVAAITAVGRRAFRKGISPERRLYTSWTNSKLGYKDIFCSDVVAELGFVLLPLLEVVSGRRARARFRHATTKRELEGHLSLALKFMTSGCGFQVSSSISARDLAAGKDSLVFVVLREVFLHSVAIPRPPFERGEHLEASDIFFEISSNFLEWCNIKLRRRRKDVQVDGFASFRDGKLLVALIDCTGKLTGFEEGSECFSGNLVQAALDALETSFACPRILTADELSSLDSSALMIWAIPVFQTLFGKEAYTFDYSCLQEAPQAESEASGGDRSDGVLPIETLHDNSSVAEFQARGIAEESSELNTQQSSVELLLTELRSRDWGTVKQIHEALDVLRRQKVELVRAFAHEGGSESLSCSDLRLILSTVFSDISDHLPTAVAKLDDGDGGELESLVDELFDRVQDQDLYFQEVIEPLVTDEWQRTVLLANLSARSPGLLQAVALEASESDVRAPDRREDSCASALDAGGKDRREDSYVGGLDSDGSSLALERLRKDFDSYRFSAEREIAHLKSSLLEAKIGSGGSAFEVVSFDTRARTPSPEASDDDTGSSSGSDAFVEKSFVEEIVAEIASVNLQMKVAFDQILLEIHRFALSPAVDREKDDSGKYEVAGLETSAWKKCCELYVQFTGAKCEILREFRLSCQLISTCDLMGILDVAFLKLEATPAGQLAASRSMEMNAKLVRRVVRAKRDVLMLYFPVVFDKENFYDAVICRYLDSGDDRLELAAETGCSCD